MEQLGETGELFHVERVRIVVNGMGKLSPMLTAKFVHWATPAELYKELNREFFFTYDPCPLGGQTGLVTSWKNQRVYCNPPYGRTMGRWLEKAHEADLAVFLLPARTDTKWWHKYVMQAAEIRFLKGRLKFGDAVSNAPFPSVVVIFVPRGTNGRFS